MKEKKVTGKDCVSCGACCGPPLYNETWPVLGWKDVLRLHAMDNKYHLKVLKTEMGSIAIKTKTDKQGTRCTELKGTVGQNVACGIYEHRPEVCRQFQPDSDMCRDARRHAGVEPRTNRVGIHV